MQNTPLPFPGAAGTWSEPRDRGEGGGDVCWHFSVPCPLSLPIIQSPWSPEGFFWMPGVGSALLLTFAPCSWKFLGWKVRLYLGCAPRAPARVKFHLVTPVGPHVGPKPRRCWSCQELTAPCVLIILSLLGSSSQLPPPALCPSGWIPKARQRGWSSLRHPEHPGKGGSVQPQL